MPDVVTNGGGKEVQKDADDGEEEEWLDEEGGIVVAVPPDGGWGWVVVMASFFCNALVDGMIFSFGAFLIQIPESLNDSKAAVSLIGSLLSGFCLIAGPVASALANRYGFRAITVVGSAIACAAFAIASTTNSVTALCFWYGFVGGVGLGLIFVPAVISVGFYFERWRALATGIAMCGSGIGTFVLAPITTYLLQQIGWRRTMLIQAGLVLNCVIFGLLFRPLRPKRVMASKMSDAASAGDRQHDLDLDADLGTPHVPLLMRIKMAREMSARTRQDSITSSCYEHELFVAESPPAAGKFNNNNSLYPTIKQVLESQGSYDSLHLSHGNLRLLNPTLDPESLTASDIQKSHINQDDHTIRSMTTPNNTEALLPTTNNIMKTAVSGRGRVYSESRRGSSVGLTSRSRTMSNSSSEPHRASARARKKGSLDAALGSRPLYRDDIFYTASVSKLPQYTSQTSGLEYTLSVTRLPTWTDMAEETDEACPICPEAVRRALATLFDTSVLGSPTFLLLAISSSITMMGFFVPFMFITDRAINNGGMEAGVATLLVSAIGVANTLGRVICGLVTSVPGASALLINNMALTAAGVATILSGLSFNPAYQFSYAVTFGLAISCFASLRSILIVDLIGLEKLTNAFGLLLLFQGLSAAVGAPLAGLLTDVLGSYNASFYFAGTLILISGIMCYPLKRINAWEKRKQHQHLPKVV